MNKVSVEQSPRELVKKISIIFKVLSDPTRLALIRLLASRMENELCVQELSNKLSISFSAASQHIRLLKSIDLLHMTKDAQRVYYSIDNIKLAEIKIEIDKLFNIALEKCTNYKGDVVCLSDETRDCTLIPE